MVQLSRKIFLCSFIFLLIGCGNPRVDKPGLTPDQCNSMPWEEVVGRARGTEVHFAMWSGDEGRNRYYREKVAAKIKYQYEITLKFTPTGDVADIVNKLLNEKGAEKNSDGNIDLIWINGENFRTARQGGVLWGPFSERLPNIGYYDDQARRRDFGTDINGYEAPYQRAQFVFAYDTARVNVPPRSFDKLRDWVKTHPGRFTYLAPPDFTGSAFIRQLLISNLKKQSASGFYDGIFDEWEYRKASALTIEYLNEIKPYLWRNGETYPATPKEADRLFANNEIDFTMSYGPSFASERIARGEYPPTTRTFILEEGSLGNYSFLAIPFNAANLPGALVVIDHLMSPAHAIDQSKALGSLFPMRIDRLSAGERAAVAAIPRSPATLSIEELTKHQLPEPDAEYLDRLEKDWREKVLRQ